MAIGYIPCSEGMRKHFSNIYSRLLYVKELLNSNRKWDIYKIQGYLNNSKDVEGIGKIYVPWTDADVNGVWLFSRIGKISTTWARRVFFKNF